MKYSVITDEVSQDFAQAVEFATRHHLDGVELRSVYDHAPFEYTRDDIARIKSILADAALPVCCMALPLFKCSLDDGVAYDRHLDGFKHALDFMHDMHISLARGFAFLNDGTEMPTDAIALAYQPVVNLAAQAGVTIVLEAEPSVFTTTAAAQREVIQAIVSPHVQALWDGGNLLFNPAAESPMDAIAPTFPYIRHVHVKDAVRTKDSADCVPIGMGQSDVAGQLAFLKSHGYDGWVSLETHYRKHALSEAAMRNPAGSAFTDGGMEASEESIILLQKITSEL